MKRPVVVLSLILLVLLSACGPRPTQAPTVPPPTAAPPTAAAPSPTSDPPEPSPTASPPPNAEGCTDAAAFVADVTIPDYSHFGLRETFTKVWEVKNTGTCTWTADYKAVYARGDALGAPPSTPLSETAPGATLDISMDMAAPRNDGRFSVYYRLTNAQGVAMPIDDGDSIWIIITVGRLTVAAPTAAPAPPAGSGSAGLPTASCVSQANAAFASQTVDLINAARAANGLPALTVSSQLGAAAQSHSEDMACHNFLSHAGWNGSSPTSRVAAAGYAASLARENIFAQPPQYGGNPQAAMDWWMNDPIHRDAILDPGVTEIGIGYASYSRSDLIGYFTAVFAAP